MPRAARIPLRLDRRQRLVGERALPAACVRGPTRIWPIAACCWSRAATLTASPLTISSPRVAASGR